MDFCVRIANHNISIHCVNAYTYKVCKDFLIDANVKPDIEIHVDQNMIDKELNVVQHFGTIIPSESSLESTLVHNLIAEALLDYDTLLMHGAVVAVDNVAYMFSAKSGTGKTTHIKKWLKNVEGSVAVNGDKPMIAINPDGVFACGTPWCGKEYLGTNSVVPLRSIVFMERNEKNHIEQVTYRSIFPKLLEQTFRPTDAVKMKKTLELLFSLKDQVSFYSFAFNNFREDAFRVSFNALTKQTM